MIKYLEKLYILNNALPLFSSLTPALKDMNTIARPFINKTLFDLSKPIDPPPPNPVFYKPDFEGMSIWSF